MADEDAPVVPDTQNTDVDMVEDVDNHVEIVDNERDEEEAEEEEEEGPQGQDGGGPDEKTNADSEPSVNPQTKFLDFLKSPIVTLKIGNADEAVTLRAHRAILTRAPYFETVLAEPSTTMISLDEDVDAVGCFLQYQYTGEYFPRRRPVHTDTSDELETDPSIPSIDTTGAQLLKHARVYTLAEKFGMPDLKTLAHSKIHRINSTAVGEIEYARYVYGHTSSNDVTIRRPVAAFWATRSHVLRHEAEHEFRTMCLEYPQFGFDVLSLVLDAREKRARAKDEGPESTPGTSGKGRKRMRPSVNV